MQTPTHLQNGFEEDRYYQILRKTLLIQYGWKEIFFKLWGQTIGKYLLKLNMFILQDRHDCLLLLIQD